MSKLLSFIKNSKDEMTQNVTWMSYTELQDSSVLVLVATIIIALIIWAVDSLFNNGLSLFYSSF